MRSYLVFGVIAVAAAPLFAQPAPPPAPRAPMMMDRTVTRAEVQDRVQRQFAKRDANRDGVLTSEELAMRGGKGGMMHREGMRDPGAAFDRIDANRDGAISRDEFTRAHEKRVERRVVIHRMGQPGGAGMDHGDREKMHGMQHGGRGMLGNMLFRMADENKDGRVTLAEATGTALRHFDRMDSNRDGRLTPEERTAGGMHIHRMRSAG